MCNLQPLRLKDSPLGQDSYKRQVLLYTYVHPRLQNFHAEYIYGSA